MTIATVPGRIRPFTIAAARLAVSQNSCRIADTVMCDRIEMTIEESAAYDVIVARVRDIVARREAVLRQLRAEGDRLLAELERQDVAVLQ